MEGSGVCEKELTKKLRLRFKCERDLWDCRRWLRTRRCDDEELAVAELASHHKERASVCLWPRVESTAGFRAQNGPRKLVCLLEVEQISGCSDAWRDRFEVESPSEL